MTCDLSRFGDFLVPETSDVINILESLRSVAYPSGDWVPSFEYSYSLRCNLYVPEFILQDTPSNFTIEDLRSLARSLDEIGLRIVDVTFHPQDTSGFLVRVYAVPVGWLSAHSDCYTKEVNL